jgi:hypothetical protein
MSGSGLLMRYRPRSALLLVPGLGVNPSSKSEFVRRS